MKRSLLIAVSLSLLFSLTTFAQKKRRTPTSSRSRTTTPAPPPKVETQQEAQLAAETLKSITRFIFVYGKIANGLEVAEDQIKKSRVAPRVIEQNVENKNGVIKSIGGLKEQVDKLGQALQAHPKLQVQYVTLGGVTQKILEAQTMVSNSRFDEAGRSLVTAAERLTEILLQVK